MDFQSCQRRLCVDIAIVDDEEVEDTEWFSVSLLRQSGTDTGITIEPAAGQINILDHDSMIT